MGWAASAQLVFLGAVGADERWSVSLASLATSSDLGFCVQNVTLSGASGGGEAIGIGWLDGACFG